MSDQAVTANFSAAETALMERVFELAAKGCQTTQPNPRVGCVLVKDGEIVGEGYHSFAGEMHAEREALKHAGERARGATAYVNLEPCCHQGRTPPCTDGLIDAGVVKVIAAMRDPNPLVAGGGFETLKLAGIEVASGLLEEQARWLNRGFITRMQSGRPWVRLKSAATLDGRTADADGFSKWITGSEARAEVQRLRAESSAIVTGIGTVLADDPQLNVRLENTHRQPLRVVLDSQLKMPLDAKIIGDGGNVLLFTCSDDYDKQSAFAELGVEVLHQAGDQNRLVLEEVLAELANWQCNEVLLEAGQTLCGAFLQNSLVDEAVLYYGGSMLGDRGKSVFVSDAAISFDSRPEFVIQSADMIGQDARIVAVHKSSKARLAA